MHAAVFAMALTLVPYLFGYSLLGADDSRAWYAWLGYNLDDSSAYLSWMRQAADGSFFQRNLFTTEEQAGRQFNLFFLFLGGIASLLHLPLIFVYHAARLILGVAFLRSVWWLLELLVPSTGARKAAFLLVCFSAGLGWLPWFWQSAGHTSPSDVWQPEAITFLCLYLSPLFLVSLLLMVGVLGGLIVAERTGRMRFAVCAGVLGLLLGNIHTYDVITLTAVWGGYLALRTISERKLDLRAWGQAIVAGLFTAVSTGYTYYLLRTEEVFRQRAAVPTVSGDIRAYLYAYAPLMALAVIGLTRARRQRGAEFVHDRRALLLLAVWSVLNLAVAYLPLSFNRKLVMGEHLPLAILAGVGLYSLAEAAGKRRPIVIAVAVVLLALTNVRFLMRDIQNFLANRAQSSQRPYLFRGEVAAMEWLRQNAPTGAAIQPLPWIGRTQQGTLGFFDASLACFAPGMTGRPVHTGHWGETPDFRRTMGSWVHFIDPSTTDAERIKHLRQTRVKYLVFSQKRQQTLAAPEDAALLSLFASIPPTYLRLVPEASSTDADVYEVRLTP